MNKDPNKEYRNALDAFAEKGNRWRSLPKLAYWGKAAGLDAGEIVADARARGVADRDADIRRSWNSARPPERACAGGDRPLAHRGDRPLAERTATPPPPPFVRDTLGGDPATAGKGANFHWLMEMSPELGWLDFNGDPARCRREMARLFLGGLFDPEDALFIDASDRHMDGRPGVNIRSAAEFLAMLNRGEALPGDLATPNPLSGERGETADGKPSFIAQACVKTRRFMLVEFDALPLGGQILFWRNLLLDGTPLAQAVASITYSGGKSLHALVRVREDGWEAARGLLRRLLCTDPDPALRADEQALRPIVKTRLPGASRRTNGKAQDLLYLAPEARPLR